MVLERPAAVQILPGFEAGSVSVQDAGAQLAAPLLEAQPGMRVLDACAAPGGKTLHIAQRTPELAELVAVDDDAARLDRVRENLERARREAVLLVADLRTTAAVPGTGLFRPRAGGCALFGHGRDPPASRISSMLRRPSDIESFAATQRKILATAFELLKPGGRLIYCTCSVMPAENEGVVAAFLRADPRAAPSAWPAERHAAARNAGSAGRLAAVARRGCGNRWLLLCLCH